MNGISDTTMQAVEYALQGVARRAEVHGQNISNVNTPGYRSTKVAFETHLAEAIDRGTNGMAALRGPAVEAVGGLPDQNGNDVNLESEMVGLLKNNLTQDAMVQAWNFKMNVLRSAIGGR